LVGTYGVGPLAGVMAWGMLMSLLAWACIERRAAVATAASTDARPRSP
jgi:hypothetical protein